MSKNKNLLVDVGLDNFSYPMKVASRQDIEGQSTVANISITARIIHKFQDSWIHKFMRIIHKHRNSIGTETLQKNIFDYLHELEASSVKINFNYPYFMKKITPKSHEICLVRYNCTYTAIVTDTDKAPKVFFKIEVPVLTTDPVSIQGNRKELFAEQSKVQLEVQPHKEIYPEDLIDIVDKHCLAPVYSFLTQSDQSAIIQQVHSKIRSSVIMVDAIKEELAHNSNIEWYSVSCENLSMLNCYNTVVGTEKNMWIPSTCYEFENL